MPSVIDVRGLTKRFGEVLAVDRLSFTVERGTVTGFLGPNGAGKTTTLRMLLGLVRPDAGTAAINGRGYTELDEPLHQVGAVLEASGFHPGRTAQLQAALAGTGASMRIVAAERAEITGVSPEQVAAIAAAHAIPIVESTTDAGLEDAFLSLTAGQAQEVSS